MPASGASLASRANSGHVFFSHLLPASSEKLPHINITIAALEEETLLTAGS